MNLDKLFYQLRTDLVLTQAEMAARLKVSQSSISKIEMGQAEPRLSVFLRAYKLSDGGPVRRRFDRMIKRGLG